MTAKQVLLHAASMIKRKGWIQGEFKNARGVCVIGAIQEAAWDLNATDRTRAVVLRRLRKVTADYIAEWNDDPLRTKREVLAALRKAAGQ